MLEEMGIETDIDLQKLLVCSHYALQITKKDLPGHIIRAGKICRDGSQSSLGTLGIQQKYIK